MKKALIFVFAFIFVFSSALPAFADVGGPSYDELPAYISNSAGADIYEYDYESEKVQVIAKLPADTKVTIMYEADEYYKKNYLPDPKADYFCISCEKPKHDYVYVNSKDIALIDKTFGLASAFKLSDPLVYYTCDNVDMYAGPSRLYDKVGTIPKGERVVFTYGSKDESSAYHYTTWNGISGWVDSYEFSITNMYRKIEGANNIYTGKILVTGKNTRLWKDPFEDKEWDESPEYVTDFIPEGTVLEYSYYLDYPHKSCFLTEYNGTEGWIVDIDYYAENGSTPDVAIGRNSFLYAKKDIPLLTVRGNKNSKSDMVIPKGTICWCEYSYCSYASQEPKDEGQEYLGYDWYYIVNGDTAGWFYSGDTDDDYFCSSGYINTITINIDTPIYKAPDSSEKVATLRKGTKAAIIIEDWGENSTKYYIQTEDGTYGWFTETYDDDAPNLYDWGQSRSTYFVTPPFVKVTEEQKLETEELTSVIAQQIEEAESKVENVQETAYTEPVVGTKDENNNTIIICVAAAVVLCITAVVLIKFVKKKKTVDTQTPTDNNNGQSDE